ncbi:MAG TPA: hypothetical protein PK528_12595 [Syntrophorhabdus sp.]|nr:hypothetical protein [Syntrophorhabdus sp.]
MKKEVRFLRTKAIESLILSIEIFNRPSDVGRTHGVLIFLDHAFEMLLKAAILHRGGRIREPRAKQTIGFDACVRKAFSDANIKFLSDNQTLTAQMINSLRDAAQHHILDISEQHLYIQSQAGLSLFRDVFKIVFDEELMAYLPMRVLPLSTTPPIDLATLFDNETKEVKNLLAPGVRRHTEAEAKLRSLAIVEKSLNGEKIQPSIGELRHIASEITSGGKLWNEIFPCVATVVLTANGYGPSIDLRISKTGMPIQLVKEGTPGAAVVAVKRVDELSFYNLSRDNLAEKVNLSGPKTTAIIRFLKLQSDSECYKRFIIGKTQFNRYSQKAIIAINKALEKYKIEDIWKSHGIGNKDESTMSE